jgi:hypothetical protein
MRKLMLCGAMLLVLAGGGLVLSGAAARPGEKPPAAVSSREESGLPPCVVATVPASRQIDVDPSRETIRVTFDRPLQTGRNYAWMIHRGLGEYPGVQGATPRWEDDGRTCVLPVKLAPGTLYAVGVNSFRHHGFHAEDGMPAVPYVLVFRTAPAE